MAEDDLVYLVRRAAEERARALKSRHAKARAIHTLMADAYDNRAGGRGRPEKSGHGDDRERHPRHRQ